MIFTSLVQANLKTRFLGQQIEYYGRLESTNSEAWEIIDEGVQSGALLITDNQYKGRGRSDRKWYAAPDKSLTFSILLFSDLEPVISGWLPILSGVAIQKALAQFNASVKLKWPNDLLLNGKKIGGILCESKVKGNLLNQVVIGIGLNVNETKEDFDPAIQSSANSLHIASKKFYQRERVLAEILNELEPWISGLPKNIDKIQFEWEAACGHLKEEIQFHKGDEIVSGIFKSLGESGSAVIEVDGKEIQFYSGEIN
ncbi:MAG TPA: biotin--[acetyl-CoA-carboxylase] ligase [Candidatus Marinimicrobia bacterium]|jgi:BirA family biotin operon repressor/biotin-[acetyl-CoA-carboxylase] ligase|nr:biotin--[acetyl-CoA-carboxylase] ligase [Candidatus Neomarinimicrobiota bacterium]HIB34390.1 biotin--[acetyl-CoA-carboxylase] ligase [Candidatus Neomarinimicrobiota bacterium]